MRPWVDCVLTFEELQALFDSRDLDIASMEQDVLDNASYFGRIFARSGGLTDAVREGIKEHGCENFDFKPVPCDGIEACRVALLRLSKNLLNGNFVEGMACFGGCINGAGCLTHGEKNTRRGGQVWPGGLRKDHYRRGNPGQFQIKTAYEAREIPRLVFPVRPLGKNRRARIAAKV